MNHMRMIAILLCGALAGCGGGNAVAPPTFQAEIVTPAPAENANATFVLKIPAKPSSNARRRHYITSSVQGVSFSVTSTAGTSGYAFYALTPQATYCATGSSGLTCTLNVVAPPGSDTFVVDLYDATKPGAGYVVSTATVTQTISAQSANTINVVTDAVPTFISLGITNAYPPSGSALTIPLDLEISDPDGNIIIGTFAGPLTVQTTDTTGAVTFSKTTLNQASDATGLTLNYNGAVIPVSYVSVTASIAGESISSGSMPFDPAYLGPGASSPLVYFATPTAAAQTLTLSGQNGLAGTFSLGASATYTPVCTGYATVTGTSPTFTITPNAATFSTPSSTIGICWLTATGLQNSSVLPVAVMISP